MSSLTKSCRTNVGEFMGSRKSGSEGTPGCAIKPSCCVVLRYSGSRPPYLTTARACASNVWQHKLKARTDMYVTHWQMMSEAHQSGHIGSKLEEGKECKLLTGKSK